MSLVHRGRTDVYLEWGNAWICLLERPGTALDASVTGCVDHLAFSIEEADFEQAVEVLVSSGTTLVRGPVFRGGGRSVNFLDPDGNQLELFTGTLSERMKVWVQHDQAQSE